MENHLEHVPFYTNKLIVLWNFWNFVIYVTAMVHRNGNEKSYIMVYFDDAFVIIKIVSFQNSRNNE